MRCLRDCVVISAPAPRVWEWLEGLTDHYTDWHPAHVSAEWVRGEANRAGSVLRVVEDLGGRREMLRFEMTRVDPPRRLEYRMRGHAALVVPRGSFAIDPAPDGARFTAEVAYRFGRAAEVLFRGRVGALRTHIREEGENLKRILETKG